MIAPAQLDEVIRHARSTFPNEACGLLACDRDGRVTKVYCMYNAEESPITYRLDSGEQLAAMLEIDDSGWELGAVFHSHPRTRAYPSATDVDLAFYPEARYVIVSLADWDQPDVRAFQIQDGRVTEEILEVTETAPSPPSGIAPA